MQKKIVSSYPFDQYAAVHRQEGDDTAFGSSYTDPAQQLEGFALYATTGIRPVIGPLKAGAYRVGFTVTGSVEVELGLEQFTHQPGSINLTAPGQLFSFRNASEDFFGYYMLFTPEFLEGVIFHSMTEFPFFAPAGISFFQLNEAELEKARYLVLAMHEELHTVASGRRQAVQWYLSLLLLEARRSYERQQLAAMAAAQEQQQLVPRFHQLVSKNFLDCKQVADYASLMNVTANHLDKVVKEATGKTASDWICDMLLLEAKEQLKRGTATISELAFYLRFSEPAAFNRFFKKHTGLTPLQYREFVEKAPE
jgi:AraC-like DNA-binding protein